MHLVVKGGAALSALQSVLFMHIAEACLEIGFSLTALMGWCGRLSVHDSSFSVYGPAPSA